MTSLLSVRPFPCILLLLLILSLLSGCLANGYENEYDENDNEKGDGKDKSNYFQMVDDLIAGKNYYRILGLEEDVTQDEVRKTFRKLARQYHPDKNKDEVDQAAVQQRYVDLNTAYAILSDPQQRQLYDQLLNEGIPWQDKYYGRYAHRMGAPVHDLRAVLVCVVIIVTICQYLLQVSMYNYYMGLAKQSPEYQLHMKKLAERKRWQQGPKDLRRRKKKEEKKKQKKQKKQKQKGAEVVGEEEEQDEEEVEEPEIEIVGIEKPNWRRLYVVRFALFLWEFGQTIYVVGRWVVMVKLLRLQEKDEDYEKVVETAKEIKENWKTALVNVTEKQPDLRRGNRSTRRSEKKNVLKSPYEEFEDEFYD